MTTDLTVPLENRPGALAEVGEALAEAGINIEGVVALAAGEVSIGHVLVEDAGSAQEALEAAGIDVQGVQEVLVVDVVDEPGVLGETCRRAANAGVNLNLTYVATGTRLVMGADDLGVLRDAVGA